MPRRIVPLLALIAVLHPVSSHRVADATQVIPTDLREMSLGSTDILVATVEATRSYWNDARTRIYTEVTVRVDESLKGVPSGRVSLVQMGGELDGVRLAVEGSPAFRPGDEAVLFLWRDPAGRAQVNGLAQGKFDIRRDPASGERMVSRSLEGLRFAGSARAGGARSAESSIPTRLEDLKREIRLHLAAAGRGRNE